MTIYETTNQNFSHQDDNGNTHYQVTGYPMGGGEPHHWMEVVIDGKSVCYDTPEIENVGILK